MIQCEVCGNHYDKPIRIHYRGLEHQYDCFECAIHDLAPKCVACGLRVIGHGVENGLGIYCSAHCARVFGEVGLKDRTPPPIALNPEA
jgi:hypothetical protein